MAKRINIDLYPEETFTAIYRRIKDIRRTRSSLIHPSTSNEVEDATILDHYEQLKEIVDKLILFLRKNPNQPLKNQKETDEQKK
jgi:hypothetical protein